MKIAGIVLIAIQVLAMFGGLVTNGTPIPLPSGGIGIYFATLVGYFLPAIIGIVLLVLAKSKQK